MARRSEPVIRHAHPQAGATLLEAIVALVILATAGIAAVSLAVESMRAVEHAHAADARMSEASALFDAVTLWTRDDLDRRLGDRPQGRWRMRVDRPVPTLYIVTLTDSLTRAEVLQTSLFRPPPIHAHP